MFLRIQRILLFLILPLFPGEFPDFGPLSYIEPRSVVSSASATAVALGEWLPLTSSSAAPPPSRLNRRAFKTSAVPRTLLPIALNISLARPSASTSPSSYSSPALGSPWQHRYLRRILGSFPTPAGDASSSATESFPSLPSPGPSSPSSPLALSHTLARSRSLSPADPPAVSLAPARLLFHLSSPLYVALLRFMTHRDLSLGHSLTSLSRPVTHPFGVFLVLSYPRPSGSGGVGRCLSSFDFFLRLFFLLEIGDFFTGPPHFKGHLKIIVCGRLKPVVRR